MYYLNDSFVIKKTILGEDYLFNKETAEIYELNETALFILKNSINHCIDDIITKVCTEYEFENEAELVKDVELIIKEFCEHNILRTSDTNCF